MNLLGLRIRERRSQLGITQEELAQMIQKDQTQIWKYETGKTQPTAPVLFDLTKALDTTADYLLGLTDDPNRPVRSDSLTELEIEIIQLLRSKSSSFERSLLDFIKATNA